MVFTLEWSSRRHCIAVCHPQQPVQLDCSLCMVVKVSVSSVSVFIILLCFVTLNINTFFYNYFVIS